MAARTDGHGPPLSGGFHPDPIFWEMLSAVMFVASPLLPLPFPILCCEPDNADIFFAPCGEKLTLSPRGRNKRLPIYGQTNDLGVDADVNDVLMIRKRPKLRHRQELARFESDNWR